MRTLFERIRKYGSVISTIIMVLFLAVLIGGTSTAWADPKHDRGYKKNHHHKRYVHPRPHYKPYYEPRPVYVPPPVYYAPPPAPWGITIFAPPIIIRR